MLRTAHDLSRRALLMAMLLFAASAWQVLSAQAQTDPLPSWNDGAAKKSITDFVTRVTTQGAADFVPVAERIATFDNDGTLWSEQPVYFQVAFAIDRVKAHGTAASGLEDQGAVQISACGRPRGSGEAW